jgi:hypothetical protein
MRPVEVVIDTGGADTAGEFFCILSFIFAVILYLVSFQIFLYRVDLQPVDQEKVATIVPDVEQSAHEDLQGEPKLSMEGAELYKEKILDCEKFLTVSIIQLEYSSVIIVGLIKLLYAGTS